MSTKWNNAQKLQKTPKVCKKGPDDLPPELQQFRYYPLQAWIDWKDTISSDPFTIAGIVDLEAFPASNVHNGSLRTETFILTANLAHHVFPHLFTYTVTVTIIGVGSDAVLTQFTEPLAELPFTAGQFTWIRDSGNNVIQSKIYS